MKDEFVGIIRMYEREREYCFPYEKLGVADRVILNMVVRIQAKIFRDADPDRKILVSKVQDFSIAKELEKYGFKPKESMLEYEV